uniref:Uncharacterized protein n=1 Tax=Panagrolaimus sp. PS1159 TaxID=55785 RepID=A0AC35G9I9_9BILA
MHYRPDSQQPPYQNSQFPPMYAPVSMQNQTMPMQTNSYASVQHRPQSQPPQMMHTGQPPNQMIMPQSSQSIYGNDLMSSDAMHTSFDDIYMPMSDLGSTSSDVNMRTSSITNELPNSIPGDGINSMMQQQSMSGITPNAIGEQAYSEIINVEDRFQFSLVSDPSVPNGPLLKCKLNSFFYDDVQNAVYSQFAKVSPRNITEALNSWDETVINFYSTQISNDNYDELFSVSDPSVPNGPLLKCKLRRDMQLPPVFLIIPKGYPQTPVGFHRVELDIDSFFYDDVQNAVYSQFAKVSPRNITEALNSWDETVINFYSTQISNDNYDELFSGYGDMA